MKSPPLEEVLKPLKNLERLAWEAYEAATEVYEQELEGWQEAKKEDPAAAGPKPVKPTAKRYLTQDPSYEQLGVMMAGNPDGILLHRDELISVLRDLDRPEKCNARSFYMTSWSGNSGYTFDRIGRGSTRVKRICLSLVGGATPDTITKYINDIDRAGQGGDGLFQRFGLAVWPDVESDWVFVDRYPNKAARDRAYALFEKFDGIEAKDIGAVVDTFDITGMLSFKLYL